MSLRVMLREYDRKLLKVRPNVRTKLEILRELRELLKRPGAVQEILDREFRLLLREVWDHVRPNAGYSLVYHRDSGALKFQLHLVCLEILDIVLEYDRVLFLSNQIIETEELGRLFELVDAKNKHVHCCLDNLTTTWSRDQTKTAYQLLSGASFGVMSKSVSRQSTRYGTLFEVVLVTQDGSGVLVSELMSTKEICAVPHFRSYGPDSLGKKQITDICRISHVISPQYVWVQFEEDWGVLDKIQQELNKGSFNLTSLSRDYTDENVIVRLSESGFTFRGQILEGSTALGPEPAQVLAIDFGWTCTVPKCDMYQEQKVLERSFGYNIACICKLADVLPPESNDKRLILGSLKVLYWITQNLNWVKAAFTDPSYHKLLLSLLYNSQDLDTVRHVLYVLANAAADFTLGRTLLDPLTAHVGQFMECVDVMRPVMLFYRTIIQKNQKVAKKLTLGPGMGLIMKIYSEHQADDVIQEHFVDIAKEIFKEVDVRNEEEDVMDTHTTLPNVASTPRTRAVHDPYAIPTFEHTFSNMEHMREYSISIGERTAFVQHINNSHLRDEVAREVASLLNHKGGVIYLGVTPDANGEIRGMKLTKKQRDDINLLVDDIMTDTDTFKRTIGSSNISSSLIDVEYQKINNTFNTRLNNEDLMIAIISVKPLGKSGGLVMFNDTKDKASIDYDRSKYEWGYYNRDNRGRKVMSINEVRQLVTSLESC